MADYTIDFSVLSTANPYTFVAPLLTLGNGATAWRIDNGSGLKIGTFGLGVSWGVHDVTYGNLITAEVTLGNASVFGDNPGAGIFIRSGTGVGAGYVGRVDGSSINIYSMTAGGTLTLITGVSQAVSAGDVVKLTFNQTTGDLNAYHNGTLRATQNADSTYTAPQRALMGAGVYLEWTNSNLQYISAFAGTGVAGGTPGNATGAGATQNATAPAGTAAVTGVVPGYSNILRDTDTGTPLANATGLVMSYRVNSNDAAVAWSTTTGTTDATGRFTARTGLAGSTGSMGAVGSVGYLTIENSAKTIVATYKITIVDLGS